MKSALASTRSGAVAAGVAALVLSAFAVVAPSAQSKGGPLPALGKKQFIAEADAICTTAEKRIGPIMPAGDPAAPGKSLVTLARVAYAWAGIEAKMAHDLRALHAPAEFRSHWETSMDALDRRVALELVVGDDAVRGDRQAIRHDGLEMMKAGAESINAIHGYGLEVCGADS